MRAGAGGMSLLGPVPLLLSSFCGAFAFALLGGALSSAPQESQFGATIVLLIRQKCRELLPHDLQAHNDWMRDD